jgi:hypothetical protein
MKPSLRMGLKHKDVPMKIKVLCLTLSFALGGCATCQRHPVWCAVGAAVVVGTAAAVIEHHHDQQQMHDRQIAPGGSPQCRSGVCPP